MANRQSGFTVLELIIVVVFLLAAGTVVFIQKRDLEVANRDSQRKTAINAIYYNLEDIYYPANQAYPEKLSADALRGMDPSLLKDTAGKPVGEQVSQYRYEPKDCQNGKCKGFSLRADLEHETDFIKESRNK